MSANNVLHSFLLTHPVWDVTYMTFQPFDYTIISTHTSRVGCDRGGLWLPRSTLQFLLTHPVWDVTLFFQSSYSFLIISTHTSRVGCDHLIFLHLNQP